MVQNMTNLFFRSIAGAGLLLFGLTAGMAQDRDRDHDRDDSWYRTRDTFYHGDQWRAHMFQRVREDLNRVESVTFRGRDEFRIARTEQELNDLQNKLASGQYDQPELDRVVAGLQRVVESNRLSPRDRDMLNDDLTRLKDYREHHDTWAR